MPRSGPRPHRVVALALTVALGALLPACGDDDGTGEETATSAAPPSTARPSPSGEPAGCPEEPPPVGDRRGPPVAADVDGDGIEDEVAVHVVEPATVELVVDHGAGGRTVVAFDDDSVATFADIRVVAVGDVDADGDDDVWLVVAAGASVEVVTLVLADGCGLVRPEADGWPNAFPVGASVTHVSGIECVEGGFLQHEGEQRDEQGYRGTTTRWSVTGDRLARDGEEPFTAEDAVDQLRYGALGCP